MLKRFLIFNICIYLIHSVLYLTGCATTKYMPKTIRNKPENELARVRQKNYILKYIDGIIIYTHSRTGVTDFYVMPGEHRIVYSTMKDKLMWVFDRRIDSNNFFTYIERYKQDRIPCLEDTDCIVTLMAGKLYDDEALYDCISAQQCSKPVTCTYAFLLTTCKSVRESNRRINKRGRIIQ